MITDVDEVGKVLSKGDFGDGRDRHHALEKAQGSAEGRLGLDQAAEESPGADYDEPGAAAHACLHSPRMLAPDQHELRQEADVLADDQRHQAQPALPRSGEQGGEWSIIFPEIELQTGYNSFDLMDADLGRVFNILDEDPDASKYGFLPYMATHSRGSVGSLLASSYPERINSAANLILTKGNTLLAEEEINMCTVLRMNRNFMEFMRRYHPDAAKQRFKMTVISEDFSSD